MAQNRSRFVLLCQQTLAVALVAAVTAPAASVVSLDIVEPPHQAPSAAPAVGDAGAAPATSVVAARPVNPVVSTVPLGGVSKAGLRALADPSGSPKQSATAGGGAAQLAVAPTSGDQDLAALSAPQPVDGLATIGVTWAPGAHVPDESITVSVRTRRGPAWSDWTKVPYHQEEGPDPSSSEGSAAKPGTDPVYVGQVDDVQVRALTESGTVPAGMTISLVDPGDESTTAVQKPAIDTGDLDLTSAGTATTDPTTSGDDGDTGETGDTATLSASVTTKPRIYSRSQWGADERMRDKSSLHYGEVHGGFVHHTVNANGYSRSQVPSILRGIYAYHTQSRGWSDVGYNFLVDRFGRIWEGRYGGVGRPVVGAHTLGYNDDAFAMSAIGNFDVKRPSAAMVAAYGRLFAWKLSLHGVRAGSKRQFITKRWLPAIDGHRDVGQTACPGRYLYAKIPTIRRLAAEHQRSFASRARYTNLVGIRKPDIVVRSKTTKKAYLIRSDRYGRAGRVTYTGASFPSANKIMSVGDWNRDGHADVIARSARTGRLFLYRGNGRGHLAAPRQMGRGSFAGVRLLAAVGDMTGDGYPDLQGQPRGRSLRLYAGNGSTGFKGSYVSHAHISATGQLGVNLWSGDGAPDSMLRTSRGLMVYPGNGPGGLTHGHRVGSAQGYDWLVPVGDLTGDGRFDLVGRSRATGRLWVLPRTSSGIGARRRYAGDMRRFDLAG